MLRKVGEKIHGTRISAFDLLTIDTTIRMTSLLELVQPEHPFELVTKLQPAS